MRTIASKYRDVAGGRLPEDDPSETDSMPTVATEPPRQRKRSKSSTDSVQPRNLSEIWMYINTEET
ncbi:hypothetical protein M413DRAFT_122060 [Hebeloma cylindrosporum]|uniref:Uncharacterized protein n=1 Tax=Hebeloma cylindrosporum TaxID=76867 RepID=A0A0C3CGI6_HEBCY|nr:hypothetical protein M413DRAFT_122060 [Hebeloma cylindrosporum h7]